MYILYHQEAQPMDDVNVFPFLSKLSKPLHESQLTRMTVRVFFLDLPRSLITHVMSLGVINKALVARDLFRMCLSCKLSKDIVYEFCTIHVVLSLHLPKLSGLSRLYMSELLDSDWTVVLDESLKSFASDEQAGGAIELEASEYNDGNEIHEVKHSLFNWVKRLKKEEGKWAVIQLLRNSGDAVNIPSSRGLTQLMVSCREGWRDVFHCLLESGADVNKTDRDGNTLLHHIIVWGCEESNWNYGLTNSLSDEKQALKRRSLEPMFSIRVLVEHFKADIFQGNFQGQSPLHLAAKFGRYKCIECLFDYGTFDMRTDQTGWSPVHYAAKAGDPRCLKRILDNYATHAIKFPRQHAKPLDFRLHLNQTVPGRGQTPACIAAQFKCSECLRVLVQAGANVNEIDNAGDFPLIYAASISNHNLDSFILLLGAPGIVLNKKCLVNKTTCLHFLSQSEEGSERCLLLLVQRLLEEKNPKLLNEMDDDGYTPLMRAASEGLPNRVRILLEAGVDLNFQNKRVHGRKTALHLVAFKNMYRSTDCLRLLLEAGANLEIKDSLGKTPEDSITSMYNEWVSRDVYPNNIGHCPYLLKLYREIKEMNERCFLFLSDRFKSYEGIITELEKVDEEGWSPLHLAAARGDVKCIDLLLSNGADINKQGGSDKCTPLHVAAAYRRQSTIRLLLKNNADIHKLTTQGCSVLDFAKSFKDFANSRTLNLLIQILYIEGITPSSTRVDETCVSLLIENGAI